VGSLETGKGEKGIKKQKRKGVTKMGLRVNVQENDVG